jgi:nucleoside-diphosphate-sugar epimerase
LIDGKIIIVGKKSFIGSHIYKFVKFKKKIILSYEEFSKLSINKLSKYDFICNCSVNKKFKFEKYKKKNDLDILIYEKIKKTNIKYIFLSSRKIYQPKSNIKENGKLKPVDIYATNKLETENFLKKKLKKKLIILRISNIIGLKFKKKYRKINHTFFDNYLDILKNNKQVLYDDFFKDFISIEQFLKIFELVVKKKLSGTFNVSLGTKVYISQIISWLNYGGKNQSKFIFKKVNPKIDKTSFTLNNKKICKLINYRPTRKELKNFCLKCARLIN